MPLMTEADRLRFRYAARTDVGLVRPHNEDSGFAGPYLLLVADGVGGAAAGEIASASTAFALSSAAIVHDHPDLTGFLAEVIEVAHRQLRDDAELHPERRGMSTTLTAIMSDGDTCAMAHVGDSRAYLLRDGFLTQLSHDHTLVQRLIDTGELTEEEALSYPYRSVVLQAVDDRQPPVPDLCELELMVGDRLLICSDGLSDLVDDQQIADLLYIHDLDDAAKALIAAAVDRGGRDNITCVIGEVETGPLIRRHGRFVGACGPDNLIDPTPVRLKSAPVRMGA